MYYNIDIKKGKAKRKRQNRAQLQCSFARNIHRINSQAERKCNESKNFCKFLLITD